MALRLTCAESVFKRWFKLKQPNQLLSQPAVRATVGLIALLGVGALAAPQTLSASVLLGILPFIAILGLASIGQHLVIQQRGFDLSVAGVISISAVIVTALTPQGADGSVITLYIVFALLAGLCAGLVNGLTVTFIGISPLVTTIGVNAILLGLTLYLSGGVPNTANDSLVRFASSHIAGVPTAFIVLLLLSALSTFILSRTALGRRYIAVGVNPKAAEALAVPVRRYQVGTYAIAGLFYAAAGVLLAGFLVSPTVFSGSPYMLTTIAAVVVGGSPLNGDRGSVLATVIGVFFLTYLDQLVLSLGFESSTQSIVQATIILAGVGLPVFAQRMQKA